MTQKRKGTDEAPWWVDVFGDEDSARSRSVLRGKGVMTAWDAFDDAIPPAELEPPPPPAEAEHRVLVAPPRSKLQVVDTRKTKPASLVAVRQSRPLPLVDTRKARPARPAGGRSERRRQVPAPVPGPVATPVAAPAPAPATPFAPPAEAKAPVMPLAGLPRYDQRSGTVRLDTYLGVRLRLGKGLPWLDGLIANVSPQGLGLLTPEPAARGDRVILSALTVQGVELRLVGLVRWCALTDKERGLYHLGLRILRPPTPFNEYYSGLYRRRGGLS